MKKVKSLWIIIKSFLIKLNPFGKKIKKTKKEGVNDKILERHPKYPNKHVLCYPPIENGGVFHIPMGKKRHTWTSFFLAMVAWRSYVLVLNLNDGSLMYKTTWLSGLFGKSDSAFLKDYSGAELTDKNGIFQRLLGIVWINYQTNKNTVEFPVAFRGAGELWWPVDIKKPKGKRYKNHDAILEAIRYYVSTYKK